MEPHYYLLRERNYYPASFIDTLLGRIVQNYGDPTADYCPPDSTHFEKGTPIYNSLKDFKIKGLGSSSKGPKIDMEGVLGLECTLKRSYDVQLKGEELRSIRLQQHSELLRTMMEEATVRKVTTAWTKRSLFKGPPVCMVVGLLLCKESQVSSVEEKSHEIRASGLIPIATGGFAAMGVPLAAPMGDVSIGGKHATVARVGMTGGVDEVVIIGLQLRVIRRCTWRNDVELRRKGPKIREGRQLSGSDEESDESDVGDSDDQGVDLDEVDVDLGDDPLNIR